MDADEKKQKVATALKWAGGIVGMAIISPLLFLALKGVALLLALGVSVGAGLVMLRLSPIVSMKVSNLLIKGIVNEAEANPIETMQNLLIEKTQELHDADTSIVDFETEVRNYDDQAADFSKQYPDEAASYTEISERMHEGLEQQKQKQNDARKQLGDLAEKIKKAEAHYKMALAVAKVTKLSKTAEKEIFQKIREAVAFDSVRSSLNRSFASLNMAIADRKSPALPAKPERIVLDENVEVESIGARKGGRK